MRKITGIHGSNWQNRVGNGSPVRNLFSHGNAATLGPACRSGGLGYPIGELIVRHGPFVMNTDQEVAAAIADFQAGRFGRIATKTQAPTKENAL